MARIQAVNPQTATGKTKQLLDKVQAKYGMTPNLFATLANSPAAVEAYWNFGGILEGGVLNAKLREQISLRVAQENGCGYCLSAHCAIGKGVGLTDEEINDGRQGTSPDSKTDAALQFVSRIIQSRGSVSDKNFAAVRNAGYTDEEITEIVANVVFVIFSNYFNKMAGTPIDFPAVPELAA